LLMPSADNITYATCHSAMSHASGFYLCGKNLDEL